MLKTGDRVVMYGCGEADLKKFRGKVWICRSDEQRWTEDTMVVLLEGYRGYYATKYLRLATEEEIING
ncbi:hypothetical protein [Mechercharimyces sp. CAU 1602]|uniref:hypothetical protein n=1 Tax=Mechercharimyces sp. CAU 1602 TaxID=2973933 RepID=UPI002161FBCD|nr:hypothetical protein [Mechercharimyces sp. CAU 1602]MCS1351172.1 hypothetical protein [Mechercharimyces sp. CAU 1602]